MVFHRFTKFRALVGPFNILFKDDYQTLTDFYQQITPSTLNNPLTQDPLSNILYKNQQQTTIIKPITVSIGYETNNNNNNNNNNENNNEIELNNIDFENDSNNENELSTSTSSTSSLISLPPRLPDIVWRKILNYYIHHYFKSGQSKSNMVGVDVKQFLSISLVCKRWAQYVLPYLHYDSADINNIRDMTFITRLFTKGIFNQPYRVCNLTFNSELSSSYTRMIGDWMLEHLDTITVGFNVENNFFQYQLAQLIKKSNCKRLRLKFGSGNGVAISPNTNIFGTKLSNSYFSSLAMQVLQTCTSLDEIDVGASRLGPDIAANIGMLLNDLNNPIINITRLNLENNVLKQKGVEYLADSLVGNQSLEYLNLSFNLIENSVELIVKALLNHRSIKYLNLNENGILHEGGMAIAELISSNKSLETLIISTNQFSEVSLASILHSMRWNKQLKRVSLALTSPTLNLNLLATCVKENKVLKSLSLMGNDLGKSSHFFEALLDNNTLTSLNLSNTKIKGVAKTLLEKTLSINTSIRKLNLSYAFSESDLVSVSRSLLTNTTLVKLNLSLNSLGSQDGEYIGRMLANPNCSLIYLNIGGNILSKGAVHILQSLASNQKSKLTHLILRKNQIGTMDGNSRVFYNLLTKNTTLKYLDLCHNSLSGSGKEIAFSLAFNKTLTHMDLSSNLFRYDVGVVFDQSLKHVAANGTLSNLILSNNTFGHTTVSNLKKHCPQFNNLEIENDYGSNPAPLNGEGNGPIPPPRKKRFFFF